LEITSGIQKIAFVTTGFLSFIYNLFGEKKLLFTVSILLLFFQFATAENHLSDSIQLLSSQPEITEHKGLSLDTSNNTLIFKSESVLKKIPLWISILPPLIAILLALVFREVHIALFAGIWFGAFAADGLQWQNLFSSLFRIADKYMLQAIAPPDGDTGHVSIIVFSLLIGGMVAIISNNGGMQSVVQHVSRIATSGRRSQFATWLMGILIFFDDYANTLVVGNTMRPLTDKFKVSREKLAYIVDSTAAPVATTALVTTWIGFQLSEISKGMEAQHFVDFKYSAYGLFIGSLQYAYYPIFTLFFVLLIIVLKKDFGPMLKAEKAAQNFIEKNETQASSTLNTYAWLNAVIPILTLLGVVIYGIFATGKTSTLGELSISEISLWAEQTSFFSKMQQYVSNADSYKALLWGSVASCIAAVLISVISRALSIKQSMEQLIEGLKSMLPAVVILVLAWSLAMVIEELHTSHFIISMMPANANVLWLPAIIFVISALVAFSTGSSWSTMAIMYPICIPLVLGLATSNGAIQDTTVFMPVLLNTISIILCASVLGDHCSPISDTTILSSLSTQCDHISHVRTQMPYALIVGLVSIVCGGVFFVAGLPWYICYLFGFVSLYLVVRFFGKTID
jgi:Na+/H+ antiporter NhaC